ncbi:hypothetical protein PVK06_048532 [Gossypium arboreum]|uniref:Uncharacterized protein n=1 Tax=Gossypium arboreum TaxID=29729 RepID=A0ABR0MGP8_GOSAR|nr:hypothetical protein PVK06_048532 [Gossypium arboreum]
METQVKYMWVMVFIVSISIVGFQGVDATHDYYGPCGKHDIEREAQMMSPCTYVAKYWRAPVFKRCCAIIKKKLSNPNYLCVIFQTRMSK